MSIQRYPEIVARGKPRELGRQIGEQTRDQVQGFCQLALDAVNRVAKVSPQQAEQVTQQSLAHADQYAPDLIAELRGLAEGAAVSFDQVMFLQIRDQFPADHGGCTSLAFQQVEHVGPVVAQNWDNDPDLDPFTVVISRHPDEKPATLNITQAGLIAYIGCNDRGIGACLNTLPAPQRPAGVPHYFTLRRIFETSSLDDAVSAVRSAKRAIPANIMLTTPQGPCDLEVTIDDVHLLQTPEQPQLCHTNHCLHSELTAINDSFPELIQSGARLRRMNQLTSELAETVTLEDVKRLFQNHDDHPRSICRHANDDPQTGFWQTVFSVIVTTRQPTIYASRGTPCDHPFEEYTLRD